MAIISNGTTVASGGSVRGSGSNLTGISPPTTAGAVGTYMMGYASNTGGDKLFGGTQSGGDLYVTNIDFYLYTTPSGTWRSMGAHEDVNNASRTVIWVRIS